MKINVTVDLSEFYSEPEAENFSQQIKDYIVFEVKQQMFKEFKKELTDEFFRLIRESFESQKTFFVNKIFNELVLDAKIKKPYSGEELISINDWMKQELERLQLNDQNLRKIIETQTKAASEVIAKELKVRYDLLFASQIITKINENGMLKEDVAKLLLG